ncbi:MAG: hypothetical protein ACI4EX_01495 [Lachnospiraceae bacterium]
MREIILICVVVVFLVSGYFVMKKIDVFLDNNRRLMAGKGTENGLFLAFENPMIIEDLNPLLESAFTVDESDGRL